MKTRITELLGIKYPIIQGGMQWLSRAELASAVSNAGGLGIITATGKLFDSCRAHRKMPAKLLKSRVCGYYYFTDTGQIVP